MKGPGQLSFKIKDQLNKKKTDENSIISIDEMYEFIGEEEKKAPVESSTISVDEMFVYIGEDKQKESSGSKLKSLYLKLAYVGKKRRKELALALAVMVVVTAGMSNYTLVKVDANITEMRSSATEAEALFAEEGVDAFTDSHKSVEKSSNNLAKAVTSAAQEQSDEIGREKRSADFLNALNEIAAGMIANNFFYSNSGISKTYEGALHGRKACNCAVFVSWGLQRAGLVPSGTLFWLDSKIHKDVSAIVNSPYLEVSYPNAKASSLDLQPGDIVGWPRHTAVYAGRDSSGRMTWYSAGPGACHKSGGKLIYDSKIYPAYYSGYVNHKVSVLIRIK